MAGASSNACPVIPVIVKRWATILRDFRANAGNKKPLHPTWDERALCLPWFHPHSAWPTKNVRHALHCWPITVALRSRLPPENSGSALCSRVVFAVVVSGDGSQPVAISRCRAPPGTRPAPRMLCVCHCQHITPVMRCKACAIVAPHATLRTVLPATRNALSGR